MFNNSFLDCQARCSITWNGSIPLSWEQVMWLWIRVAAAMNTSVTTVTVGGRTFSWGYMMDVHDRSTHVELTVWLWLWSTFACKSKQSTPTSTKHMQATEKTVIRIGFSWFRTCTCTYSPLERSPTVEAMVSDEVRYVRTHYYALCISRELCLWQYKCQVWEVLVGLVWTCVSGLRMNKSKWRLRK